jgi:hypothetical protein
MLPCLRLKKTAAMTGETATESNTIEVRLSSIDQLFDTLDPSPFREKDLDKDVEEFIVSWARELHKDLPFTIVVHLPEKQLTRQEAKEIGPAITRFFGYSAQQIGLELRELLRVGRRSLGIGIAVLVVSIVASQMVAHNLEPRPLGKVLEESLIIFAWVANWRPTEIFLYDWWPIARRRRLYQRLAAAKIELKPYKRGEPRDSVLPEE